MDKKEQTRLRVERYRNKQKSVTSGSVTGQSVTLLHRPNGPDYNPDEMLPDGRKRYLPCHDGQVLDRLTVPGNLHEGTKSGQHPFYGMPSVIFTPSKQVDIRFH